MENERDKNVTATENELLNTIEKLIREDTFTLDIGAGVNRIKIKVHDYVDVDDLSDAVQDIVFRVKANDFRYEVFDFMLGYHIIKLFTNIPIPMIDDEAIDYARCYDICTRLNLIDRLCEKSNNIAAYIAVIEKNVWRKLEYDKVMATNENLNILYGRVYNFIDNLDTLLSQVEDLGFDKIASELINVTDKISFIEDLKNNKTKED